jgi:methylenetetrahydrofolate reductase (NADPH)
LIALGAPYCYNITPMPNPLRKSLESGHFAVTAELTPPRGADFKALTVAANILKPAVSAVNVTDGAGARVRMSSLPAAIYLKQLGVEPVMQITCRDRNRIAIQSDLLGAAAFGINNALVLTGDNVDAGDEPGATGVFDFNSTSLVAALVSMGRDGMTLSGSELSSAPDFFPGTTDAARDPAADWQPSRLQDKLAAGARFVQMQYCFDMDILARYMQRLADHGMVDKLYFLVGLGPLRSAKAAMWMRDNLPGTLMPDGIVRRMQAAHDPRSEGINICAELIQQAREINGIAGVHLMAPGLHQEMVESVKLAGML